LRPLVIAHRGASWDAPENTIPAFQRAIEVGADYIEFDVQASRDGELVVFHDPVRVVRAALPPGTPTLDDVLDECAGRIGLAVEIKSPYLHRRHGLTGRTLAALGARRVDPDSVVIVSFSRSAILETMRTRPDLRTIQHVEYVPIRAAARYAWGVGFHEPRASRRAIALARRLGLETSVYTVNDRRRMQELAELGVGAIFTDRPDVARATLGGPGA
jgi:glycerophosphoryl diester phosphodiesterase